MPTEEIAQRGVAAAHGGDSAGALSSRHSAGRVVLRAASFCS